MTEKAVHSRSVSRRTMLAGTAGVLGGTVLGPSLVNAQTNAAVAVPGKLSARITLR